MARVRLEQQTGTALLQLVRVPQFYSLVSSTRHAVITVSWQTQHNAMLKWLLILPTLLLLLLLLLPAITFLSSTDVAVTFVSYPSWVKFHKTETFCITGEGLSQARTARCHSINSATVEAVKKDSLTNNWWIHSPLNRTARTAPCLQSKQPINFSVSPSADIVTPPFKHKNNKTIHFLQ